MRAHIAAVALAAGLFVNPASAATITYNASQSLAPVEISGTLSVPKFDASLGNLVGVSWKISGDIATLLSIANNSPGSVSGSAFVEVLYFLSAAQLTLPASPDFSVSGSTGNVTLGVGQSVLFPVTNSVTLTGLETPGAALIGPGSIDLAFLTVTSFGGGGFGGDVTLSQATDAGISFDITYEYSTIPVPAALPLMLAGLMALGGLALRRRA